MRASASRIKFASDSIKYGWTSNIAHCCSNSDMVALDALPLTQACAICTNAFVRTDNTRTRPSETTTPKESDTCKSWCAPRQLKWATKCTWEACSECPECAGEWHKHIYDVQDLLSRGNTLGHRMCTTSLYLFI